MDYSDDSDDDYIAESKGFTEDENFNQNSVEETKRPIENNDRSNLDSNQNNSNGVNSKMSLNEETKQAFDGNLDQASTAEPISKLPHSDKDKEEEKKDLLKSYIGMYRQIPVEVIKSLIETHYPNFGKLSIELDKQHRNYCQLSGLDPDEELKIASQTDKEEKEELDVIDDKDWEGAQKESPFWGGLKLVGKIALEGAKLYLDYHADQMEKEEKEEKQQRKQAAKQYKPRNKMKPRGYNSSKSKGN